MTRFFWKATPCFSNAAISDSKETKLTTAPFPMTFKVLELMIPEGRIWNANFNFPTTIV